MSDRQKSTVADVVWPWRAAPAPKKDEKVSRHRRAAIEGLIMIVIGTLLALSSGHKKWLGVFLLGMSVFVLTGGFLVPPMYRAFRRFGDKFAKGVGIAFTWILLLPFFYIVFTIGRIGLALKRKDPLHRGYDPRLKSYWTEHKPVADLSQYRRQY